MALYLSYITETLHERLVFFHADPPRSSFYGLFALCKSVQNHIFRGKTFYLYPPPPLPVVVVLSRLFFSPTGRRPRVSLLSRHEGGRFCGIGKTRFLVSPHPLPNPRAPRLVMVNTFLSLLATPCLLFF